jgi:hypothetical protein
MEENTSKGWVPKRQLTMGQTIAVIAVGGLMLLLSIVIPTESPSTAHTIKVIVGILGFIIGLVGLSLRPTKAPKNPKE